MRNIWQCLSRNLDIERSIALRYALISSAISAFLSLILVFYDVFYAALGCFSLTLLHLLPIRQLRARKNFPFSCYFLLILSTCVLAEWIWVTGSIYGPFAYWIVLSPLIGGLILQTQGLRFGAGLAIGSLAIMALAEQLPGHSYRTLLLTPSLLPLALGLFSGLGIFISFFSAKTNQLRVEQQTQKLHHLLNIVTHDIANPLTIIAGHSELLLLNKQFAAPDHDVFQRIRQAAEVINQILQKVRQIQAAKVGKLHVETSAVILADVFEKLRFIFDSQLKHKNQQLEIKLPDSLYQVKVIAEPVLLLNEVFCNLVSNAIKFSKNNSVITIDISQHEDQVILRISDHGVGIPPELLPYLFDDLRSTSRSGTNGEVGTGFGLPLVKHIVDAFGGSIEVSSHTVEDHPQNHGSVFTIYLRAVPTNPMAKTPFNQAKIA